MIHYRDGTKFITEIPAESGKCVGMLQFKDHILLACEHHIYQLSETNVFEKITFALDRIGKNEKRQKDVDFGP